MDPKSQQAVIEHFSKTPHADSAASLKLAVHEVSIEQLALIIKGTKGVKALQGSKQCSCGGLVHEVKAHQIVKAQGLQLQSHTGQIDTLDLRQAGGR